MDNAQFLEIVNKLGSPEDFENNDGFPIPADFKFSELVEQIKKEKERLSSELQSTEYYKDRTKIESKGEYEAIYAQYSAAPSHYQQRKKEYLDSVGLGMYEKVEDVGGEGQGDHTHFVLHFPDVDKYLRADGSYASHVGTDFSYSTWQVVRPQQVTITVYE